MGADIMKKLLVRVCSIGLCLCLVAAFSACKSSNRSVGASGPESSVSDLMSDPISSAPDLASSSFVSSAVSSSSQVISSSAAVSSSKPSAVKPVSKAPSKAPAPAPSKAPTPTPSKSPAPANTTSNGTSGNGTGNVVAPPHPSVSQYTTYMALAQNFKLQAQQMHYKVTSQERSVANAQRNLDWAIAHNSTWVTAQMLLQSQQRLLQTYQNLEQQYQTQAIKYEQLALQARAQGK